MVTYPWEFGEKEFKTRETHADAGVLLDKEAVESGSCAGYAGAHRDGFTSTNENKSARWVSDNCSSGPTSLETVCKSRKSKKFAVRNAASANVA